MYWLPHTTPCWQSIHIVQASKEMDDAENIPKVSYLWNFFFTLSSSFISVIHKDVTRTSWKGRLSQNKMLNWSSLFNIIDRKEFPTIPARLWETATGEADQGNYTVYRFHVFLQLGFLWSPYQQLHLLVFWFLGFFAAILHHSGPGEKNDVS